VACGAGDCAVVRQLLDARADPAATHALCSAASGGHVEVGERITCADGKIEQQAKNCSTWVGIAVISELHLP